MILSLGSADTPSAKEPALGDISISTDAAKSSCQEYWFRGAWSDKNVDLWDPEKSGVITGRQHHTLDVKLFGANTWLTGFYLEALKAGAEMAEACGESETSKEYSV